MFELYVSEDVKKDLRALRKELKELGYKQFKSRTNRHIGTMHLNYETEYFIKGNLAFELEFDKNNGTLKTMLNSKKYNEYKEIRLGDILSLA